MKHTVATRPSSDHQQKRTNRRRFIIVSVAATAAVVLGIIALWRQTPAERSPLAEVAVNSGSQYFERARVQIFQEERELGTIGVAEERIAEFFLRNIGGKPLEITRLRTSCLCTTAQIIIGDEESPPFSLDAPPSPVQESWKGVIQPSLTATIRVFFSPSLTPVRGSVAKNVMFNTNDPDRPSMELGIHATVQ